MNKLLSTCRDADGKKHSERKQKKNFQTVKTLKSHSFRSGRAARVHADQKFEMADFRPFPRDSAGFSKFRGVY